MKKFIVILVAIVSLWASLFVLKSEAQWVSVTSGISGNSSPFLLSSNGKIYAANSGGVYISTNNGIKWQRTSLTAGTGVILKKDSCLLAGGSGGLFVSTNEGLTWSTGYGGNMGIRALTVSGTEIYAAQLYAGIILKSTNNGFNWSTVYSASNSSFVTAITAKDNYIFAATSGSMFGPPKVIVSTNNGSNWNSAGLDSLSINSMNTINGIIYAGTNSKGIYTSTNNGINWTNSSFQNYEISYIMNVGNEIFVSCRPLASGNCELYKSTNNGVNWVAVNTGGVLRTVSVSIINNITVLGIESNGVYLSSDNGINWQHYMPTEAGVTALYKGSARLFAGVTNDGIYYSDDGGLNWIQSKFAHLSIHEITSNGNILYAGTTAGLWTSTDNGVNWTQSAFSSYGVYAISNLNSTMYTGVAYSGIYKSTNNGLNWMPMYNRTGCVPYSFYQKGSRIFAGMFMDGHFFLTGLYFSTNDGISWDSVQGLNSVHQIKENANYMFASCSWINGIMRSGNNGVNWNLMPMNTRVYRIEVSGNYVFAGSDTYGIYMSTDNGETWRTKNEGFSGTNVRSMLIDGSTIFAGEIDQGLYKRSITDITSVNNLSTEIPSAYSLGQNYPNPFNPSTVISFQLSVVSDVSLMVYDVQGREVQTLVNERLNAGTYEVRFDGSMLTSGVYFYKMVTEGYSETKRMVLIK